MQYEQIWIHLVVLAIAVYLIAVGVRRAGWFQRMVDGSREYRQIAFLRLLTLALGCVSFACVFLPRESGSLSNTVFGLATALCLVLSLATVSLCMLRICQHRQWGLSVEILWLTLPVVWCAAVVVLEI